MYGVDLYLLLGLAVYVRIEYTYLVTTKYINIYKNTKGSENYKNITLSLSTCIFSAMFSHNFQ